MLTVACVCVPPLYNETHVARLFSMVCEHLDGFAFQPIWESDKPGWWAKIDLFQPGRHEGRVLYFDLDVTVVGDLRPLASDEFTIARDWGSLGFNSSVMAWTPSEATERIYTEFTPDVMDRMHGDQNWIGAMMPEAVTFPRRWVQSYKGDYLRKGWHPDTRVQVFHGQPKPWEIDNEVPRLVQTAAPPLPCGDAGSDQERPLT